MRDFCYFSSSFMINLLNYLSVISLSYTCKTTIIKSRHFLNPYFPRILAQKVNSWRQFHAEVDLSDWYAKFGIDEHILVHKHLRFHCWFRNYNTSIFSSFLFHLQDKDIRFTICFLEIDNKCIKFGATYISNKNILVLGRYKKSRAR